MLAPNQNYCQLTPDELSYFYNGLKMTNKYLYKFLPKDLYLIIALRNIQFSDCYIQIEGFTAAAQCGQLKRYFLFCTLLTKVIHILMIFLLLFFF